MVGNPSDGYGGAVLATVIPALRASVTAEPSEQVGFERGEQVLRWESMSQWRAHVRNLGHGDEQRIVSAALWSLDEHLRRRGPERQRAIDGGVVLRWSTDIPRSVGLAGSSALAVGTIVATATTWGVHLDRRVVAALALSAERDVLGITAGWQDRIVQSFGRTVLVDAAQMDVVDDLDVPRVHLPDVGHGREGTVLVGWLDHIASPSGDYHGAVRLAADRLGQPMAELADLARRASTALERGDLAGLAAMIEAGWLIRQSCAPLSAEHTALVEVVRAAGVAATTPGSGGSVVALCLDASELDRATAAMRTTGCTVVRSTLHRDRSARLSSSIPMEVVHMGFLDKLKGLTKGRKKEINQGIDKAADLAASKVPDEHDAKVEAAAEKAKDVVEKLPD